MKEKKIETIQECIEVIESCLAFNRCPIDPRTGDLRQALCFLRELNEKPTWSPLTKVGQADQMIRMLKTHYFSDDNIAEILKGSISL